MAALKNSYQLNKMLLAAMICSFFNLSAQLEFMHSDRLFFLGADNIEGKYIIAGVYVLPIDPQSLKLEINVADDWVTRDSLREIVTLDRKSIRKDKYFVSRKEEKRPAYRFTNKSGLEIWIAKENFYESYDAYGVCNQHWNLSYAQVFLPKKRKSYVRSLPLMFEK